MPFTRAAAKLAAAEPSKPENPYLDPQATDGLDLVASIISSETGRQVRAEYRAVDTLLDQGILSASGRLVLSNGETLYNRLLSLSDRLMVPAKYRLLKSRSVVGIGGKFSAGKSQFINSLLPESNLPVGVNPMTSVPTYLVCESGRKNPTQGIYAYTRKGSRLLLDEEKLDAISHKFKDTYNLGLAQFLSFIAVYLPNGLSSSLALLDTPGYNNSENSVSDSYTDLEKARTQLRVVDALIWVLDIQNGTLQKNDMEFIQNLSQACPILFILNKSDLKTPNEQQKIQEEVRATVQNNHLNVFDVLLYSAQYPENYPDSIQRIQEFMDMVAQNTSRAEKIDDEIQTILDTLSQTFKANIKELKERRNRIGKLIFRSNHVLEMQGLVSLYGSLNTEIDAMQQHQYELSDIKRELKKALSNLQKKDRFP